MVFTYMWVIFRVNVGKYSSTMEHLGMGYLKKIIVPSDIVNHDP
jgi:hypothetical protein